MLSHRIDYAHYLVGPIEQLCADTAHVHRRHAAGQPSDVDDWVSILADFKSGATGVLESTKLATGVGEGHGGEDLVQINGSERSAAYSTQSPLATAHREQRRKDAAHDRDARAEFLVHAGLARAIRPPAIRW